MDQSTLVLLWRVGVVAFVVVAPTLMFIQLLRFLEWLRDDELIARVAERNDFDTSEFDDVLADMATEPSPGARGSSLPADGGRRDALVRCGSCGKRNVPEATYCSGCLNELE